MNIDSHIKEATEAVKDARARVLNVKGKAVSMISLDVEILNAWEKRLYFLNRIK